MDAKFVIGGNLWLFVTNSYFSDLNHTVIFAMAHGGRPSITLSVDQK